MLSVEDIRATATDEWSVYDCSTICLCTGTQRWWVFAFALFPFEQESMCPQQKCKRAIENTATAADGWRERKKKIKARKLQKVEKRADGRRESRERAHMATTRRCPRISGNHFHGCKMCTGASVIRLWWWVWNLVIPRGSRGCMEQMTTSTPEAARLNRLRYVLRVGGAHFPGSPTVCVRHCSTKLFCCNRIGRAWTASFSRFWVNCPRIPRSVELCQHGTVVAVPREWRTVPLVVARIMNARNQGKHSASNNNRKTTERTDEPICCWLQRIRRANFLPNQSLSELLREQLLRILNNYYYLFVLALTRPSASFFPQQSNCNDTTKTSTPAKSWGARARGMGRSKFPRWRIAAENNELPSFTYANAR